MKDDSLLDNQESEQSTFDPTKVKVVDKWPGGKYHAEMIDYAPSAEELGILSFILNKQTKFISSEVWSTMKHIGVGAAQEEQGRLVLVASFGE